MIKSNVDIGGASTDVQPESTRNLPLLFQPIQLKGVELKNRLVTSPMCQYASVDGKPTDWHFAHCGRLAIGGAGLVFTEETAVEARGRKTHDCAGIWSDDHISGWSRVVRLIHDIGAKAAIQLGHSGGRASSHGAMKEWKPLTSSDAVGDRGPWQPVSASAVAVEAGRQVCRMLDTSEIAEIVRAWQDAARRSDEAGFDVLEIHGAHGYLIQQFLSPITNHRQDAYGGSRENRMRLALEITEAVRAVWPNEKPLWFRVSAVDGTGGDWDLDDTLVLAGELKARGVDVIDCSSGGISGSSAMPIVPRIPGYHLPYARRVKRTVGIATVAVGLITEPAQAEEILVRGDADLIAMALELMFHADWPIHAAKALHVANHLDLFPPAYAYRLNRREAHKAMPVNKAGALVPLSRDGRVTSVTD